MPISKALLVPVHSLRAKYRQHLAERKREESDSALGKKCKALEHDLREKRKHAKMLDDVIIDLEKKADALYSAAEMVNGGVATLKKVAEANGLRQKRKEKQAELAALKGEIETQAKEHSSV